MTTLFDPAKPLAKPRASRPRIDDYLRELHKLPEGWRAVRLNCSPDEVPAGYMRVEGGVCPLREDASVNWRKRTRGTEKTLFAKMADFDAWLVAKALELGICSECWGNGDVVKSVHVTKGTTYRPCLKCKGEPCVK